MCPPYAYGNLSRVKIQVRHFTESRPKLPTLAAEANGSFKRGGGLIALKAVKPANSVGNHPSWRCISLTKVCAIMLKYWRTVQILGAQWAHRSAGGRDDPTDSFRDPRFTSRTDASKMRVHLCRCGRIKLREVTLEKLFDVCKINCG